MEVLKLFDFKQPILLLKTLLNGNLGVIDAQNTLRIIHAGNYGVIDGFKTKIVHERYSGCFTDISLDGEHSISAVSGTNQASLFSLSKKGLLNKVGRHDGEVESVGFDPEGRYCVTCGKDGKAFAWVIETSRLAFTLPEHSDVISTVSFHDNGQWVATGSYDKSIKLLNTSTMQQSMKLLGHSSKIVAIIFLPHAHILSVEREGGLIVWDMNSSKVSKRLSKMNDDVTSMCISSDKQFVFVGTKLGYIGLYDMQSMEQITPRYIKESEEITSLTLLDNPLRLAVGTIEGKIRIYALQEDEAKYAQMIREQQYNTFYAAVEANPMLLYSEAYVLAEQIWLEVLEEARHCIEKSERQKLTDLFSLYSEVPKKNAIINQILSSYEKYEQFQTYVLEGHLPLAYSLAKQYSALQETELYLKLERRWKKLFFKAQELILETRGDEQARQLLAPFRGISEKTVLIQQLFEQRKMYAYIKKILGQHDYAKFFALVKMHPFLKEFAEYASVMEYANMLFFQAQKAYNNGDYATAKKACKILVSFPDFAKEAQEMEDTIRVKHLFYDAITSKNLSNAFSYLSTYPLLYDVPEAKLLEHQWNEIVDDARRFASIGSAQETLEIFQPYFDVRDKYAAMAAVISQAYCVQLEQKIQFKLPQEIIENGIQNYVEIFGIDEGIRSVCDYFKLLYQPTLDLEQLNQGSLQAWIPSNILHDITQRI